MTSGFDPLPQGEGCRGLVGMLRIDSSLKARGRGVGVGEEGGRAEAGVTSPGDGGIGAGLCRRVSLAASCSGHGSDGGGG